MSELEKEIEVEWRDMEKKAEKIKRKIQRDGDDVRVTKEQGSKE